MGGVIGGGGERQQNGAKITATFEDGPFYSRSLLSTHILGERVPAVHESLSLDRFKAPWVQFLLPRPALQRGLLLGLDRHRAVGLDRLHPGRQRFVRCGLLYNLLAGGD